MELNWFCGSLGTLATGGGGVQGHREVQVQDVWIVFTRMLCALGTMCRYNEPVLARYSFSREPLD